MVYVFKHSQNIATKKKLYRAGVVFLKYKLNKYKVVYKTEVERRGFYSSFNF